MRTLRYDDLRAEALRRIGEVRHRAGMDSHKDQPHDDEHWDAQLRVDRARLARLMASGELTFVSPRYIRWLSPEQVRTTSVTSDHPCT